MIYLFLIETNVTNNENVIVYIKRIACIYDVQHVGVIHWYKRIAIETIARLSHGIIVLSLLWWE